MSSTNSLSFMIENGLNLRDVVTSGSVLHINSDYDDPDIQSEKSDHKSVDVLGKPVSNYIELSQTMAAVDKDGLVKKKILVEGGGLPLHEGCTVSIAYSGYFEHHLESFDVVPVSKPLVIDLKDNGLLPGLLIATKSMLVGETSVFLFSYKVMYGELGIPPRIKPKADCVFYIKLVKNILTPKNGPVVFSEPNMFRRVYRDVKQLFASGFTLYKINNYMGAIQLFKKAANMLHKCRLADEEEEKLQEKMLRKLYINLVICYNHIKQPLKACITCNELNRLNSLWNNGKVLLQNAKALRMIGDYDSAEKKLLRAIKIAGKNPDLMTEYNCLKDARQASNEFKLVSKEIKEWTISDLVSKEFKSEVDDYLRKFKSDENDNIMLPSNLNSDELAYVREACIRENLFFADCVDCLDDAKENKI